MPIQHFRMSPSITSAFTAVSPLDAAVANLRKMAERTCYQKLRDRLAQCMMPPSSRIPIAWECISLVFILFDTFLIPFDVFLSGGPWIFALTMTWTSRIFWLFDIPFHFGV